MIYSVKSVESANPRYILNKKFSFPLNINSILVEKVIDLSFFQKYTSLIKEVYIHPSIFSIPIRDMNGKNIEVSKYLGIEIIQFLYSLEKLNIGVCLVINDIFNLEMDNTINDCISLIQEYSFFTSAVLPNKKYISLFRNAVPNIELKNTVLLIPTYEEILNGDYDDFDVIYLHDEIIHNHDKFLEIKGLKKFGTVVNFHNCNTGCTVKQLHYKHNCWDIENTFKYCCTHDYSPLEKVLKNNSIPMDTKEFLYYSDVLDIYKLQGRQDDFQFLKSVRIIEGIFNNSLTDKTLISRIGNMNFLKWKLQTRNCGGNCIECKNSTCDEILKVKSQNIEKENNNAISVCKRTH